MIVPVVVSTLGRQPLPCFTRGSLITNWSGLPCQFDQPLDLQCQQSPSHPAVDSSPGHAVKSLGQTRIVRFDMPSFLSDLRRKSRNSFKTEQSADSASSGNTSIDEHADGVPQNKSSSTLSSFFGKTSDPGSVATTATTTRSKSSTNLNSRDGTPNGARTPPASSPRRPPIKGAGSSGRYSMLVRSALASNQGTSGSC